MEKLVKESLNSFLNEMEESQFTPEQKSRIEEFISDYSGDFEDEDIHSLADEMGLDKHEVEEYIYSLAREEENESSYEESEEMEEENYDEESSEEEFPVDPDYIEFNDDIQQDTLENESFRKVLYTGKNLQLVLMTLKPGENIGMEHHEADQFFRFEGGTGECIINGNTYDVKDGSSVLVPGGAEHDVINTSDDELLQLYTIYGPPNHMEGVEYETKEEAEEAEQSGEDKFDGETTE